MEVQERLFEEGVKLGMCAKFRDSWGHPDTKELCEKYFSGMDFCIQHDYPNLPLIKELFRPEDVSKYGVFFTDGECENLQKVCVLGDADVHVYVKPFGVCDIYARHNSKVHLHLGHHAFCYVTMLDNTTIFAEDKADKATLKGSFYSGWINKLYMFDTINYKNTGKEA